VGSAAFLVLVKTGGPPDDFGAAGFSLLSSG
jgi:hypothetical protein